VIAEPLVTFCYCFGWLPLRQLLLWVAVVHPKEKPPINVVGDVAGHIAIVVVCYIAHFLLYSMPMRPVV